MVIEGLNNRISKIRGQVEAIGRMVERGDSAEAILVQINAVKSAMHKVGELVLLEDIRERLSESGVSEDKVEEALTDIKRFSGLS